MVCWQDSWKQSCGWLHWSLMGLSGGSSRSERLNELQRYRIYLLNGICFEPCYRYWLQNRLVLWGSKWLRRTLMLYHSWRRDSHDQEIVRQHQQHYAKQCQHLDDRLYPRNLLKLNRLWIWRLRNPFWGYQTCLYKTFLMHTHWYAWKCW